MDDEWEGAFPADGTDTEGIGGQGAQDAVGGEYCSQTSAMSTESVTPTRATVSRSFRRRFEGAEDEESEEFNYFGLVIVISFLISTIYSNVKGVSWPWP